MPSLAVISSYEPSNPACSRGADARDILEMVEKTDPAAMDAGAPTALGLLYDQVPGFPIGFGDKVKARFYLQEAVRYAPNGLDANYFYGDFLYRNGEQAEAVKVLQHALTFCLLYTSDAADEEDS